MKVNFRVDGRVVTSSRTAVYSTPDTGIYNLQLRDFKLELL